MSSKKISRQRIWQIERVKNGECILCGGKRSQRSKTLCEKHRAKRAEWAKKRYRRRKNLPVNSEYDLRSKNVKMA